MKAHMSAYMSKYMYFINSSNYLNISSIIYQNGPMFS